jgi:hypothetical protein
MSETSIIKDTPTIQRTLWKKRWQSAAVVSLAVFLLLSLIWPLSTRGYQSRAEIEVDIADHPGAIEQFEAVLDEVIRRNLSQNALRSTLGKVKATMPEKVIDQLVALPSIRPMLGVSMNAKQGNGAYLVDLKYNGRGTAAENYLLNVLTTNVVRDFLTSPSASIGMGTGPKTNVLSHNFLQTAQTLKQQAVDSIAILESRVFDNGIVNGGKTSPFMTASSKASSSMEDPDASAELKNLRQSVQELSTMIEDAHNQHAKTNGAIFSVRKVRSKPMKPIGCDPQLPHLILLGMFSCFLGAVVAFNYRPFEEKGFENVHSIASRLGVPVAATLNRRQSAAPSAEEPKSHWANELVSYSELFLFAVTIVVLGFCIVDAEIRSAFADNLFHGFARIFWMFR